MIVSRTSPIIFLYPVRALRALPIPRKLSTLVSLVLKMLNAASYCRTHVENGKVFALVTLFGMHPARHFLVMHITSRCHSGFSRLHDTIVIYVIETSEPEQ